MSGDNSIEILTEEIDEEIISKMPLWFRILRDNYKINERRKGNLSPNSKLPFKNSFNSLSDF